MRSSVKTSESSKSMPLRTVQTDQRGSEDLKSMLRIFSCDNKVFKSFKGFGPWQLYRNSQIEKNLSQLNVKVWLLSNNIFSDKFIGRLQSCKEKCSENMTSLNLKEKKTMQKEKKPMDPKLQQKAAGKLQL